MENKETKKEITSLKKKVDRKPKGDKAKGVSFPIRHGKLGVTVTR